MGSLPDFTLESKHSSKIKDKRGFVVKTLANKPLKESKQSKSKLAIKAPKLRTPSNRKLNMRSLEAHMRARLFEENSLAGSSSPSEFRGAQSTAKLNQVLPHNDSEVPADKPSASHSRSHPASLDSSQRSHAASVKEQPIEAEEEEAASILDPIADQPQQHVPETQCLDTKSKQLQSILLDVSGSPAMSSKPVTAKPDVIKGRNITNLRKKREKAVTATLSRPGEDCSALHLASGSKTDEVKTLERFLVCIGDVVVALLSRVSGCKAISSRKPASLSFNLSLICIVLASFLYTLLEAIHFQSATSFAGMVYDHVSQGPDTRPVLAYDAALALGALLGLIATSCFRLQLSMSECQDILEKFASQQGFSEDWQEASRSDALSIILLWLVAVGERIRCVVMWNKDFTEMNYFSLTCFIVTSFILGAILFSVMQICRGLRASVDDFSFQVYQRTDFAEAVRNWSVLQALIRSACSAVQPVFILLQGIIIIVTLAAATDFYKYGGNYSMLFSGAVVVLNLSRVFLHAASVTDHCERVPAFINSLNFGNELDPERMYVVWYIKLSQTGFYILEVQLTSALVLKSFYVLAALVVAVLTKFMSGL